MTKDNKDLLSEIEMLNNRVNELEESEQRFRATLYSIIDGMISVDDKGAILQMNQRAEILTGWKEQDALGHSIRDIFCIVNEETGAQIENPIQYILNLSDLGERPILLIDNNSHLTPITCSCALLFDTNENIIGLVLVFNDNTEHYWHQKLLQARLGLLDYSTKHTLDELLLEGLSKTCDFADSPVGFYCFVEENQSSYSLQKILTRNTDDYYTTTKLDKSPKINQTQILTDCIKKKVPVIIDNFNSQLSDDMHHGNYIKINHEVIVPVVRSGKVRALLGLINKQNEYTDKDIEIISYMADVAWQLIESKKIDYELQKSEGMYRTLSESLPVFICSFQADFVLTYINGTFAQYLNISPALAVERRFSDIFPSNETKRIKNIYMLLTTEHPSETYTHRAVINDHTVWHQWTAQAIFDENGYIDRFQAIGFDITDQIHAQEEKERLQKQLTQAQKMESIGRLAGGIAHDFNNMLSVIMGETEMIMLDTNAAASHYSNLQDILNAAQRSADLTRQLLAFARKQVISPKVLDLNETIEGILKMLRRLIGEDIELEWIPTQKLWYVRVDPGQIDQILANLCVNARDAIVKNGHIIIETGCITVNEDYCVDYPGLKPGEYVLMSVRDNGIGMSKETLDKIFEPFYTTKEIGKGTGLGLATVYGIVKQNKGFIDAQSEPDQGTTIKVYFPRYMGERKQYTINEKKQLHIAENNETILLVEDDPNHLRTCLRILEKLGYHVLAAQYPIEALELAKTNTDNIKMIISDIVMPQMNGRELVKQVLLFNPNIKQLFMSGYPSDIVVNQGMIDDTINFINKPFSMDDFAYKVRNILDKE